MLPPRDVFILSPLWRHLVQPYSPLYWVILSALAFAGRSNVEVSSNALQTKDCCMSGDSTSTPFVYNSIRLLVIGLKKLRKFGFSSPTHKPQRIVFSFTFSYDMAAH